MHNMRTEEMNMIIIKSVNFDINRIIPTNLASNGCPSFDNSSNTLTDFVNFRQNNPINIAFVQNSHTKYGKIAICVEKPGGVHRYDEILCSEICIKKYTKQEFVRTNAEIMNANNALFGYAIAVYLNVEYKRYEKIINNVIRPSNAISIKCSRIKQ